MLWVPAQPRPRRRFYAQNVKTLGDAVPRNDAPFQALILTSLRKFSTENRYTMGLLENRRRSPHESYTRCPEESKPYVFLQ